MDTKHIKIERTSGKFRCSTQMHGQTNYLQTDGSWKQTEFGFDSEQQIRNILASSKPESEVHHVEYHSEPEKEKEDDDDGLGLGLGLGLGILGGLLGGDSDGGIFGGGGGDTGGGGAGGDW
jgi:uncharacterized membrane protein YgcG